MHIASSVSTAILILALLAPGCAPSLRALPNPPPGTYRVPVDTTYRLAHRKFLLHVPPGYRADVPLPLVVVLHGAFSSGGQTEIETGFSDLADIERFLVVYPEGIGIFGLLQHWNAGHCCAKAADDGVDDVGFLAEVIATVRRKLSVDPGRTYMAGMSNGGMLATGSRPSGAATWRRLPSSAGPSEARSTETSGGVHRSRIGLFPS